jgi:hypothetical protein
MVLLIIEATDGLSVRRRRTIMKTCGPVTSTETVMPTETETIRITPARSSSSSTTYPLPIERVFYAYYDARCKKRTKQTSLVFELAYESHLFQLYDDLVMRIYRPSTSTCFIIHDPVQREIFAADFRDRIVHHLIYNEIYGLFDTLFIEDSYSCRIGK